MDELLDSKGYIIKLPQNTKFDIGTFYEFLKTSNKILTDVPFIFTLNVIGKRIFYGARIHESHTSVFENQLYSLFPKIEVENIAKEIEFGQSSNAAYASLKLRYGDHFPFLVFHQMESSFLNDIYNQLNRLSAYDSFCLQIKVSPVDFNKAIFSIKRSMNLAYKNMSQRVNIIENVFNRKLSGETRNKAVAAAIEKNKQYLYKTEIDLILYSDSQASAAAKLGPIAQVFSKLESEYNEFTYNIKGVGSEELARIKSLEIGKNALHLSADELSTIFHFPSNTDMVPNLYKVLAPKAEPPLGLPTVDNTPPEDLCPLATTNYRNIREKFGIKRRDRARHMYTIGKSGSGKSKLQELLIKNDIEFGHGICVIDPHGDLIENIIPFIPESRIKDVIYFNPIDEEFPISFNPIEKVDKIYRQQVATGLIETFKKAFGANWTPRLEHVLRMTILALLDAPKASVLSILLLLTDREFRQEAIKSIEDQVVKNFWTNEFAGWSEKFDSEAIMPILNKIGQFVSNTIIRNIVGQEENTFSVQDVMDNKKILLVKLPKGILGEENTSLLGAMIITKIYQSALARSEVPESQRVPFYLYVDEFQNFATDTFANILSEARKYRLSLSLAHQYVSQISDTIRNTVFGNVGSIIAFRVGPEDAALLEKEFSPRFMANDIVNLGVREIYLKLSIDDEVKEAFSGKTLDVLEPATTFKDQIIAYSREHYCQSKSKAEGEIKKEKSKEMEVLEKLKEENFSAPIL